MKYSHPIRRFFSGAVAVSALIAGAACAQDAPPDKPVHARNIILFLGDAGGIPTLNAAGIMAHDKPLSLYIQSMPHIGLSDTSSLNRWVTDSGAGMTAIMTGHKANNGMVSAVPTGEGNTVRPVKTLLEYAEERGLSTGVITNMKIWDATPAATYAHVASRKNVDEIFRQMLAPRFGNGVDILVGKGLKDANTTFGKLQSTPQQAFTKAGYRFGSDPARAGDAARAAVLRDEEFAPLPAVEGTIAQLSKNPKGYFLMVEWDMHTSTLDKGLRHVVEMDDMIRRVREIAGPDTLILFTADHSFGLRMTGGERGSPLAQQYAAEAAKPGITTQSNEVIGVVDDHTGEEVLIAASGPGADAVHGFMPNTNLFSVMMDAYGWKASD